MIYYVIVFIKRGKFLKYFFLLLERKREGIFFKKKKKIVVVLIVEKFYKLELFVFSRDGVRVIKEIRVIVRLERCLRMKLWYRFKESWI